MPAAEVMVITTDAQANALARASARRGAGVDAVGADGSVDGGDDGGHDCCADVAGHVGDSGSGADLLGRHGAGGDRRARPVGQCHAGGDRDEGQHERRVAPRGPWWR